MARLLLLVSTVACSSPTAVADPFMLRPLLCACCCSNASAVSFAAPLTNISVMASGAEDDSWRKALERPVWSSVMNDAPEGVTLSAGEVRPDTPLPLVLAVPAASAMARPWGLPASAMGLTVLPVGVTLPEGLVPGGVTLLVGVVLPEAVVLGGITLPETPSPPVTPGGVTLPLGVVKPEADGVMPGEATLPMGVVLPESVLPVGLVRPLALRDSSFSICRIAFSISCMRTCAMQCIAFL